MTAPVYTASWSALHRHRDQLDVQPVRISRGVPKFWPDAAGFPALDDLMPEGWMLGKARSDPAWGGFGAVYIAKLDRIGLQAIAATLDHFREPVAL